MTYIGASVNNSPTIYGLLGADVSSGAGKAVKYNSSGKIVVCSTAGEVPVGILVMQTPDELKSGDEVTVQIKDIGPSVAAAAITIGSAVAVDANGKVVTADEGDFILGYAVTSASASGNFVQVQITKSGFVPVTATQTSGT